MYLNFTLPETNSQFAPEKWDVVGISSRLLLGGGQFGPIFRGKLAVRFRERHFATRQGGFGGGRDRFLGEFLGRTVSFEANNGLSSNDEK